MDLYKWIVIIAGLSLLFQLAGLPTGMNVLLERAGVDLGSNPENIALTSFFITIGTIFSLATGVGIAVGIAIGSFPTRAILAVAYMGILISFAADTVAIINYALGTFEPWVGFTIAMILVPITLGYGHSLVNWWKVVA